MNDLDHKRRIRELVASDPDVMMEIIAETQPFLAQRIAVEPDHEKAKQLMLEANDPWHRLQELYNEASIRENEEKENNISRLLRIYNPRGYEQQKKSEYKFVAIGFLFIVVIALFIAIWVANSDWVRDLKIWQKQTLEELEKFQE